MATVDKSYLYTKEHEWVAKTDKPTVYRVGISDFAQSSLGDVTFIDIPAVGTVLSKGQSFGTVESVKAVSDLYAPLSGKIVQINQALNNDPSVINTDPYKAAWIFELEISDESELSSLLKPEAYESIAQ